MNARLEYLRRRREYLVSRAAAQRSEVAYCVAQLQKPLRLLDMGYAVVKAARIHPVQVPLKIVSTLDDIEIGHNRIGLLLLELRLRAISKFVGKARGNFVQ